MLPIGARVEETAPGDWRVTRVPSLYPPNGSISATSYPTQEEALNALREGKYD